MIPASTASARCCSTSIHERSLDADLGLALALDAQAGLREDLRLLVMSATLDGARVATLLGDAPVIASEGRAYPVTTHYLGRDPRGRLDVQMTDAILRAIRAETGSILAFLPGQGEIRRVAEQLAERITDTAIEIAPLYGAMEMAAQDRAVRPAAPGQRKIVLATSIAETSLTIEGVRVVVDCGVARVPRFEPDVGVTRLETVRVSRAAADQRRGRAGRTEPGVCYRLWDEPQTMSLAPFAEPEIRAADLTGLVLDCAAWGVTDATQLAWLDPPPAAALAAARAELTAIGALDATGRLHPRRAQVARLALAAAARRDGHPGGGPWRGQDRRRDRRRPGRARTGRQRYRPRRAAAEFPPRPLQSRTGHGAAGARLGAAGQQWQRPAKINARTTLSTAALLALAFPDRIAKARGAPGQFLLANGRAGALDAADPLSRSALSGRRRDVGQGRGDAHSAGGAAQCGRTWR